MSETAPRWQVLHGDCVEMMRTLPDASVDAVVTDPPYGLGDTNPSKVAECLRAWLAGDTYAPGGGGFMGREWDSWVPGPDVWREALRVLKPGGHALIFAGSRTLDLMSMAVRLAGFEIRDTLMWVYGSGFPKSLDVSKAIDKAAGAERDVIGESPNWRESKRGRERFGSMEVRGEHAGLITTPATPDAARWSGFGTALKPAHEPIILARKPLDGTVAANVLAHGVGGLNVDGCRVKTGERWRRPGSPAIGTSAYGDFAGGGARESNVGRWPPNILLSHTLDCPGDRNGAGCVDECPVGGVGTQSGEGVSSDRPRHNSAEAHNQGNSMGAASPCGWVTGGHADAGTAARFFPQFHYSAKAAKAEREAGLPPSSTHSRANRHPTVKPVDVMRWLARLVTPPGGLILDPFNGSGTTGIAAVLEGFRYVGTEREAEYVDMSRQRIPFWEAHGEDAPKVWRRRRRIEVARPAPAVSPEPVTRAAAMQPTADPRQPFLFDLLETA